MSEWQKQSLKEAGITLIDCDHKTPLEAQSGFPYVTIPQIKNGCIQLSEARLISKEDFEIWTKKAYPLVVSQVVIDG